MTELLTVHGHMGGAINVNTAEYETLLAVGVVVGREGMADNLVGDGSLEDRYVFQSIEDFNQEFGLNERQSGNENENESGDPPPPTVPQFVVQSSVFRVRGHGLAGETAVRIEAYVWRDNGMTGGEGVEPFRIMDWRIIQ